MESARGWVTGSAVSAGPPPRRHVALPPPSCSEGSPPTFSYAIGPGGAEGTRPLDPQSSALLLVVELGWTAVTANSIWRWLRSRRSLLQSFRSLSMFFAPGAAGPVLSPGAEPGEALFLSCYVLTHITGC